ARISHVDIDTFRVIVKNEPARDSIDGQRSETTSLIVVKTSPNFSHVPGSSAFSVSAKTISPILPTASPAIGATRVSLLPARSHKAGERRVPNYSDTGLTEYVLSQNK